MTQPNIPPHLRSAMQEAGWTQQQVNDAYALVRSTLEEDLQWGPDVTTNSTIEEAAHCRALVVSRGHGALSGTLVAALAPFIAAELTAGTISKVNVEILISDGHRVQPGDAILEITGPTRVVLTAERTLLNLLCHLSGVATATAEWADALATVPEAHTQVRDTRKTIPGLRVLQKAAVVHGGGTNHRMGLGDAALIKDNHIAAVGGLKEAFNRVKAQAPDISIEVECDTLEQVKEAVQVGANLILLDNMDAATTREAVTITEPAGVKTEASGGLTLRNAAEYAATGVDYIAVGALTHSAAVLDLGLDFQ